MLPLAIVPASILKNLRGIFTDIDDTLTLHGKLPAAGYEALWRLQAAGLKVVPVTGRPAGWCDLIVRQWPIAGVVGENGALAYYEDSGVLKRLVHPAVADPKVRERLREVEKAILAEVPGSRVAKDQGFRLYDLAIDFCEEEPKLGPEVAAQIKAIFERFGARAKISSIHVNGWFGDYDKLSMMKMFVHERFGEDLDATKEHYIYCGDSPNDEPAFAYFPSSVGVANVRPYLEQMKSHPTYVTTLEGGAGFAEMADAVLKARA